MLKQALVLITLLIFCGCGHDESVNQESGQKPQNEGQGQDTPMFSRLNEGETGINFLNSVKEDDDWNIIKFPYFYNGGGISAGDINNDGLIDLFFTGNQVQCRLYLNQGGMKFKDITSSAGIPATDGWNTGVTMTDINHDGYIDIYVCRSGNHEPEKRKNWLLVNQGDLTFKEEAESYGLDDQGYSTQAVFFDYDQDQDLDMFLLNHQVVEQQGYNILKLRYNRDENVGDKLYRNDGNTFVEVGAEAGIKSNPYAYGLGVAVSDLNQDNLPDIYVANDFLENDYLYFNQGDGTFKEQVKTATGHVSYYGMGTDIADFNNDGKADVIVVDMVAKDHYRKKTNMSSMQPELFEQILKDGFHHQYMINTLQMNAGSGKFSEVSQLAGVSNTDWSWAPLWADLDNDGFKDLFITNGIRKEMRNNDFVTVFKRETEQMTQDPTANKSAILRDLLSKIPIQKIANYTYRNNGDLTFSDVSQDWNLGLPSFSTGAVYVDLDNDGDQDLVVSNVDEPASIFQNNSQEIHSNQYLKIQFVGPEDNPLGIGAQATLTTDQGKQYGQLYLTRGFQSSVAPQLHFGLGNGAKDVSVEITWPDGRYQKIDQVATNQTLQVRYTDAKNTAPYQENSTTYFTDVTSKKGPTYKHQENTYDDFAKELLLPHRNSRWGPGVAVGDVNGDGLDDVFMGAAAGFKSQLFIQTKASEFKTLNQKDFDLDKAQEDIDAAFFDCDNDGDLDLYVVSGGNAFSPESPLLQDRLYLNDGKGNFSRTKERIPEMLTSGGVVAPYDYDQDGDIDLFVGGRLVPGKYPFAPRSYLLKNNGGTFSDVTSEEAPNLQNPGLVTAAIWTDINKDQKPDLLISGEWMAVEAYVGTDTGLEKSKEKLSETGWWYSLAEGDFNQDGKIDYLGGNLGLNYKYHASPDEPFHVYCHDFDGNDTLDIVLGYNSNGLCLPVRGRECSSQRMPFIKEKFQDYHSFARATIDEIYGKEALSKSLHLQAQSFSSALLVNNGSGFSAQPLPLQAQVSSINDLLVLDFNQDGYPDVLAAGNLLGSEVETPRNDAGLGLLLLNDTKGGWTPVEPEKSGFWAEGEVRSLKLINLGAQGRGVLVVRNDATLKLYKLNNVPQS